MTSAIKWKAGWFWLVIGLLWGCNVVAAQEIPPERRAWKKWLDASTQVSDDPRRTPVAPGPRGPDGTLVLRGGRVFDGTGTPVREATVVIERNKLARILPPGVQDWPAEARVIDVPGKTVMPGLIDLHTHLTYRQSPGPLRQDGNDLVEDVAATLRGVERLRFYLECGITSVRDAGGYGLAPFRLKAWVAENRLPGPRVFPVGQIITGTGGHAAEGLEKSTAEYVHGCVRLAAGPDDWREAVREQFNRGADVIKLASHYSREEVRAAVDEAHTLGLKVMCDCETVYVQWAVEAGVDCIEHPLPRTDETIALMAQKGTQADPTLMPYSIRFDVNGGYFDATSRRFTFSKAANLEMVRRMKRAGIKMGIGTDLGRDNFRTLPKTYIQELKYFVEAGYTIPQVLVTATKTNAEILDMDNKLGTLEAGKLADVIVVDGHPETNLDDLAKVSIVIRDGNVVVEDGHVVISRHVETPISPPMR